MARTAVWIVIGFLAGAVVAGAPGAYLQRRLARPHAPAAGAVVVDIPSGYGSRAIVDLLVSSDVLNGRYTALAYLYFSGQRGRLQAGEYVFDEPLDVPGVFRKLASGQVRLYTFTVPEGLRVDEMAQRWEQAGFGPGAEFRAAAEAALPAVREIDPRAVSVEGYLFPETYSFPRGATAADAVDAMLAGLRDAVARLERIAGRDDWPLDLHDTLVLASMVESEAGVADERGTIASVFHNRLDRGMRMDCDPTVIYALVQAGLYRGRLLRVDLEFDSPYNTYRYGGLPPGPISSPGFASLRAAVRPEESDYLFFVRTVGGRHAFSRTLAEHNRRVAEYRRMQ